MVCNKVLIKSEPWNLNYFHSSIPPIKPASHPWDQCLLPFPQQRLNINGSRNLQLIIKLLLKCTSWFCSSAWWQESVNSNSCTKSLSTSSPILLKPFSFTLSSDKNKSLNLRNNTVLKINLHTWLFTFQYEQGMQGQDFCQWPPTMHEFLKNEF